MAVDEVEYYAMHQGNGLSGGIRETRSTPAVKKVQPRTAAKTTKGGRSSMTSFLQGITLGTVLLIPLGVWCWVRADLAPAPAETETTPGKAKSAKAKTLPVAPKRKPMRLSSGPAPRPLASDPLKAGVAEPEPPPFVPVPLPAPGAVPLAIPVPRLAQDLDQTPKQKKGLWRTLMSPFHSKSKDSPSGAESENQN